MFALARAATARLSTPRARVVIRPTSPAAAAVGARRLRGPTPGGGGGGGGGGVEPPAGALSSRLSLATSSSRFSRGGGGGATATATDARDVRCASTSFSDDIRGLNFSVDDEAVARVSVPQLVALLLDLAEDGQRIIREVTEGGDLGVRDKEGKDDVSGEYVMDAQTEADRRVEAYVLRALRQFCPTLPVVAEESYENQMAGVGVADADADADADAQPGGTAAASWTPRTASAKAALSDAAGWPPYLLKPVEVSRVAVYVDPLDGTNEYAGGEREAVTCLMGVAVDGTPVAGIIGQPFHGYGRVSDERMARMVCKLKLVRNHVYGLKCACFQMVGWLN